MAVQTREGHAARVLRQQSVVLLHGMYPLQHSLLQWPRSFVVTGFSQEGGTSGLALVIDQHCVKRSSSSVLLIVLGVIGGLLVLACISTVVYLMCKAAKYRQQHAVVNDDCKYSASSA